MILAEVGQPVPNIAHAVSVSLPSWSATVGYEEGEDWVLSKMRTGYPRFFIHLTIQELETEILTLHGQSNERVMLFPSASTATRCQQFFHSKLPSLPHTQVRLLHLAPALSNTTPHDQPMLFSGVHCVFFPAEHFPIAKQVWQHSGDGISSRLGEFCLKVFREGLLQPVATTVSPRSPSKDDNFSKGPRRYQRGTSQNNISPQITNVLISQTTTLDRTPTAEDKEHSQFIEERFGRNLNAKLAFKAKLAIRRRIAGCLTEDSELDVALENSGNRSSERLRDLSEDDVYLYPTGMSSIFNTHRILLAHARNEGQAASKSICFGFPYIDTLKILEKWGPGCLFYGNGSSADLDDLEARLRRGERYLALFTEFPSNPQLRAPDLDRIRALADQYSFVVVVDETVGNFINTNVLPHADVVVSSLTKVFSGDCNVMGGSCILNPHSKMYSALKQTVTAEYEDNYWAEDAVFMERNSRDFISRIVRINVNAAAIVDTLRACPIVKQVYYPMVNPSRVNYDRCRNPNGGYGGLLSVIFNRLEQAIAFFDSLQIDKGPSLGTNFTLACPYTILAHYMEMEWTSQFGVEPDLVRISVGLEAEQDIVGVFKAALDAALKV